MRIQHVSPDQRAPIHPGVDVEPDGGRMNNCASQFGLRVDRQDLAEEAQRGRGAPRIEPFVAKGSGGGQVGIERRAQDVCPRVRGADA